MTPNEQLTDMQKVLAAVRIWAPRATLLDVKVKSGLPEHLSDSVLLALQAAGLIVAACSPDEQAGDMHDTTSNEAA